MRMPASYPAIAARIVSRPDLRSACAAATTAGKTTVPGWKTEPLCRSSCSATCAAAPLTSAANSGLVLPRSGRISLGPEAGPICAASAVKARTGPESLPASAAPSQSRRSSLVLPTIAGGTSASVNPARNSHRLRVGDSTS